MKKPIIKLAYDEHHNRGVVSLRFEKDFELINKVKIIPGTTWSQSKKYWNIFKEDIKYNILSLIFIYHQHWFRLKKKYKLK